VRWAIGISLVALLCSSCGLRASHEEALAAIQGNNDSTNRVPLASPAGPTGVAVPDAVTTTTPAGAVVTSAATPKPGKVATAPGQKPTSGGSGSAAGTSASGPAGKNPTAPRQCTGAEPAITIGTVGQQSGVFAPFLVPGVRAVQAWVVSVNAAGGVACHRIKYIVQDDGGDPSTAQSLVQQLVEGDKVAAMVYMDSPITGNATATYLTRKGIPVIGSEGGSDWFYSSPVYRPQITTGNTALAELVSGLARIGKPNGETKLGVLTCLEAALCSSLYGSAGDYAKANGLDLVYRAQASLTQPTFTATCQAAKSAGVQLFAAGMDTNSLIRLVKNCKSIGFAPHYITGGPLVAPSLIADPATDGFYVASYSALYSDLTNPQVGAMKAALAKYAPGVPASISATGGWAAALLFQYAVEHADAADSAGFLRALGTMKKNDLGGLTAPLTFEYGKNAARTACYWIGQVKSQALTQPTGVPAGRICDA
jgi:branched-chain amino acid transport system substrate-binding protein